MASILLIDDDRVFLETTRRMLQTAGHSVRVAEGGQKGSQAFQPGQVDLVITDIYMPEKDGLETIRAIRAQDPNAKIFAISGGGGDQKAQVGLCAARAMGAQRIFHKPLDCDDLLRSIDIIC